MSVKTDALESAVTDLLRARAVQETAPCPRQSAVVDHAFAHLLRLCGPRIRHFIGRYGLTDMIEDAEQVCAIALHRAILTYDPAQSKFTTFVNWQLRGELQSLRFRVRADSRGSARRVSAVTLSFGALMTEDGTPFEELITDGEAEDRTARGAADIMAGRAADRLLDRWQAKRRAIAARRAARARPDSTDRTFCRPGTLHPGDIEQLETKLAHERGIVRRFLCEVDADEQVSGRTREQERPIIRRAQRELDALVIDEPLRSRLH